MSCKVYLSLGSNIGERENYLNKAVRSISQLPYTDFEAVSKIYETVPVGFLEQPMFLNIAVLINTSLEPIELLRELQVIEISLNRTRQVRWGPRTIDIDILLFGDEVINFQDLTIPHPRMFERAFVLIPLKDIYEDGKIDGYEIEQLISRCKDREEVKYYSDKMSCQ